MTSYDTHPRPLRHSPRGNSITTQPELRYPVRTSRQDVVRPPPQTYSQSRTRMEHNRQPPLHINIPTKRREQSYEVPYFHTYNNSFTTESWRGYGGELTPPIQSVGSFRSSPSVVTQKAEAQIVVHGEGMARVKSLYAQHDTVRKRRAPKVPKVTQGLSD